MPLISNGVERSTPIDFFGVHEKAQFLARLRSIKLEVLDGR